MKALLLSVVMVASLVPMARAADPSDAQVDAAFKKADPDNDGTVSRAEARKFGITRAAFDHANPDKDGTLDKKEFLAAITWQFERANPDKDGSLDLAEYLEALRRQAK